jgi:hypothetical protein
MDLNCAESEQRVIQDVACRGQVTDSVDPRVARSGDKLNVVGRVSAWKVQLLEYLPSAEPK